MHTRSQVYIYFIVVIFYCLTLSHYGISQNIVPNPSFEQNVGLPDSIGQWRLVVDWDNVSDSLGWPFSTPDYLHTNGSGIPRLPNSAFGIVSPHGGDGIMGFNTWSNVPQQEDFREYISTELLDEMLPGIAYEVSFYLTNGVNNAGGYGSDHIGIHFSKVPLSQSVHEPIDVVPQIEIDTIVYHTDWHQYTFTYVPTDTFTHMTIGNFFPDSLTSFQSFSVSSFPTAYYFIDDVSVIGTVLAPGSAVSQTEEGLESSKKYWRVYPNPFEEELHIDLPQEEGEEGYQLYISDSMGKQIRQEFFHTKDQHTLSTYTWPSGLYLIQLLSISGVMYSTSVLKY